MAKVDLKTPIWDENKKLYRPGEGVEVPDALAKALGLSKTEAEEPAAKPEEVSEQDTKRGPGRPRGS